MKFEITDKPETTPKRKPKTFTCPKCSATGPTTAQTGRLQRNKTICTERLSAPGRLIIIRFWVCDLCETKFTSTEKLDA